ncbi:nucleotidyl transferase AbiEii/AbiGii toxin family protein [Streptomyces pristinaespiralis]|nr:nucleotidyl transferase AbiEii/AbiGii toxin family protein [Streptomyces pristinaespiralis]ALC23348.1 ankyrin [Streptomyces pristinaespiralis]QMU14170.1 nucleotidyl transferase AbiEii/AbiGii toxin family protein [Streptomyces pristinaespiralis]
MNTKWEPTIPGGPDDPAEPDEERRRRRTELPRTLHAGVGPGASRHRLFDPALKHFDSAYRPADSVVAEELRPAWRAARRRALESVVTAVSASGWGDSLVLRGSMLLADRFGDAAREPKDLDFVVVPADWRIEEERTTTMLDEIASAAQRGTEGHGDGPVIDAAGAESEYIWTYERVPGRRMVLPWQAPGLPAGQVQLDFVFNEQLPVEPRSGTVCGVPLRAATLELSLAWKVLWLIDDLYPQGKDLYDAVLLAERCPLGNALLQEVFRLSGNELPSGGQEELRLEHLQDSLRYLDWDHFAQDYPQFADGREQYVRRLLAALGPTFAA